MADKMPKSAFIEGLDRLGYKIMGGMGRIFGSLSARDEEVYTFGIDSNAGSGFIDLPATVGAIAQANIPITQEADFVADRCLYVAVNPATGANLQQLLAGGPSATVLITDGGSDRTIMNFDLHLDTVAGNIQRSTPFAKRRVFRRNSNIVLKFTQLQAVETRLYFAIMGYKIYDEASLDLVRRR